MTDQDFPVLLVEDDVSLRRILARALRVRSIHVQEASSAEDAIAALQAGLRPGLVLLDLNLPGATGWDFLDDPELTKAGSPPVVITSGLAVTHRRLATAQVVGFLPKPFALETFLATVQGFVPPSRAAR